MQRSLLLFILMPFCLFGQNKIDFPQHEDSLRMLRNLILGAKKDKDRQTANANFFNYFHDVLQQPGSWNYGFDSIRYIGVVRSDDNAFRLINWNVPKDDGTEQYFCFLQRPAKKKGSELFILEDRTGDSRTDDNKSLKHTQWFGMLYYDIIPFKRRGKQYYTLLGWDGNTKITTKKVIDVIYFPGGKPRFGAPLFYFDNKTRRRIVFEYASEVQMSIKYHEKGNQIVFDHLAPPKAGLDGMYQFYAPDLTFDALKLEKGKWMHKHDVDARGEERRPYIDPR